MTGAPVVLGIDPGLSGAIAALDPAGRVVAVLDMPALEAGNGRRILNVLALRDALHSLLPIRACWIENVSSMPTDSRVSAFAFGRSVGALEAACLLSGVPVQRVTPQVWKRAAGSACWRAKGCERRGRPTPAAGLRTLPDPRQRPRQGRCAADRALWAEPMCRLTFHPSRNTSAGRFPGFISPAHRRTP